jgi:hypothetical protein
MLEFPSRSHFIYNVGYYTPSQATFVAADPPESADPRQPRQNGNPSYVQTIETLTWDSYTITTAVVGNVRFRQTGGLPQGGYACSIRSLTKFEKPKTLESDAYYWDFPNYYSLYMNASMHWPPLYEKLAPVWDNTQDGYTRAGIWKYKAPQQWQKGTCVVEFSRTCAHFHRAMAPFASWNVENITTDPDTAFRVPMVYSAVNMTRIISYTGCVDHVLRGCFNNGTCIAPNQCLCALGWSGNDCSVPLCPDPCQHGTCTFPNRCTCDKGWTGDRCTVAICAQECRNNGSCVAPVQVPIDLLTRQYDVCPDIVSIKIPCDIVMP